MSGAPPFLWAARLLVVADMHAQARVVIIVTRLKKFVQICHSISFYLILCSGHHGPFTKDVQLVDKQNSMIFMQVNVQSIAIGRRK